MLPSASVAGALAGILAVGGPSQQLVDAQGLGPDPVQGR